MSVEVVLRPEVEHADIAALRDAYAKMQALSGTDNRSWIFWAEFHGFNHYDCWHHGRTGRGGHSYPYDLFLPWHRAYLLHWEHVARDQNDAAIPPWWDWTSKESHRVGVPAAYSPQGGHGEGNPLATGPTPAMPNDPPRRTRRFPGAPSELPSMTERTPANPSVDSLLSLSSYVDFSQQLQDVHDFIHGWTGGRDPHDPNIGGDMGNIATSSFDPIFWAHHGMIDRLWYMWQLRHGVDNIPQDYLDKVLAPFGVTVREVLHTRALGYEYSTSSASAAVATGGGGQCHAP